MNFDIKNKDIAIIGCGETGFHLSILLKKLGAKPSVFDTSKKQELLEKREYLKGLGIDLNLGIYTFDHLKDYQMIVLSPGIDSTKTPFYELGKENKSLIGDIEILYHLTEIPFLCITGTNGKTTTTRLIASILEKSGMTIVMGGNMPGASLASQWDKIVKSDLIVCEISSFQLEGIIDFKPHIACYLNISPDHIDRYPDFDAYFKAKNRIYENMTSADYLIINAENENLKSLKSDIKAKIYEFSITREVDRGTFCSNDMFIFRDENSRVKLFSTTSMPLPGKHNTENILASITASMILNVNKESIKNAITNFKLSDHTLELVDTINGVKFIDDSKGTNVDSVIKALNSFEEPIILLLGGKDKGCDYKMLLPHLKKKVKKLILFGEARETIGSSVKSFKNLFNVNNMVDATRLAFKLSIPGDLVLLSPACSSFDEFKNFAHRGDVFKETVRSMRSI